jgi:serine protease AprX
MNKLQPAILVKFVYIILLLFIFLFTSKAVNAQNKYWVFFRDKHGTSFNPYEYFDNKAIERRIKLGLALYDSTDFPVNESYIKAIAEIADSTTYESRWFNAIAVYADKTKIDKIRQLRFIKSVEPIISYPVLATNPINYNSELDSSAIKLLINQTESMGGQYFREKGIDGKGLRIAVFDAGFLGADKSPVFEHIRRENRIIKTWNFPKKKEFVYSYHPHGAMVLSCIAGIINGKNMGLATGAEFLLARTEVNTEHFFEEENWLAAVEWADKNGADIINSSLGYTNDRYFPEDMNGRKSLASRAAELAARKGILVVNAVGNDGDNKWHKLGAPADADSIITVGGIDPKTNYHIYYSSYGPTADKRLKPNVCAFAHVVTAGPSRLKVADGTSFACPLVTGFAACAWQTERKLSNMQLLYEIEKSADLYPYFDYAHGYGIPQAQYFINSELRTERSELMSSFENKSNLRITPNSEPQNKPTFDFITENNILKVIIKDEFFNSNTSNLNRAERAHEHISNNFFANKPQILFYNIQNVNGVLESYYVIKVFKKDVLTFNILDLKKGQKLNLHFKGYTSSFPF